MNRTGTRRSSPAHPSLCQPVASRRVLRLIDVDNLLGDPSTTDRERIDLIFGDYRRVAGYAEGDQAVVATGCNGPRALVVELAWPEVRHCRRCGPDGAEPVLFKSAEWAADCRRFGRVVLGSSDRSFLEAIDRLRAALIKVEVVSRAHSFAPALAVRAQGCVRLLPERPVLAGIT